MTVIYYFIRPFPFCSRIPWPLGFVLKHLLEQMASFFRFNRAERYSEPKEFSMTERKQTKTGIRGSRLGGPFEKFGVFITLRVVYNTLRQSAKRQ